MPSVVIATAVIVVAAVVLVRSSFSDRSQTPYPAIDQGVANGYIPNDAPIRYDSSVPALTRLIPVVRAAVRDAGDHARSDGVELRITSGWRSAELQTRLVRSVKSERGASAASMLVKSPAESAHVQGKAVDIGTPEAISWMSNYGLRFGFCRVYANESWHFELTGRSGECPTMKTDARK